MPTSPDDNDRSLHARTIDTISKALSSIEGARVVASSSDIDSHTYEIKNPDAVVQIRITRVR